MHRRHAQARWTRSDLERFARGLRKAVLFETFQPFNLCKRAMCEWCDKVCQTRKCRGETLCTMKALYTQCQSDARLKTCCKSLAWTGKPNGGSLQDRLVAMALVQKPGRVRMTRHPCRLAFCLRVFRKCKRQRSHYAWRRYAFLPVLSQERQIPLGIEDHIGSFI